MHACTTVSGNKIASNEQQGREDRAAPAKAEMSIEG